MFQIQISTATDEQTIDLSKDCYRFGKTAEVSIPVEDDHCVTVYRRNGDYFLSNRSSNSVQIGRKSIPANATEKWSPGRSVELDNGVSLRLKEVKNSLMIDRFLSLGKAQEALRFRSDESQVVDDKVIALLCGALLFFSFIKFLETLA